MRPEILTHPNIPKPLHGMNPRSILGKDWWDKARFAAQKRTNYTCSACGVKKENAKKYQWLEGHEFWDINYKTGICEVKSIEPLCHYCHNFIHSGRLAKICGNEKTEEEVIEILEHGLKIFSDNKLSCFPSTLDFAYRLNCKTFGVKAYALAGSSVGWGDYRMVLEGKTYKSKFKDYFEWEEYYESKSF